MPPRVIVDLSQLGLGLGGVVGNVGSVELSQAGDGLEAAPREIPEGSLDYAQELRSTLSRALKASPFSRHQIAARMSEYAGVEITKAQLDAWTAESRDGWRFPMEYAAAFDAACGVNVLLELLARKEGCRVVVGAAVVDAELGRLQRLEEEIKNRRKELTERLRRATGRSR